MEAQVLSAGYEAPTYQAPAGTVWYHFLHGNVPRHQIDFMYRPEVPQGLLSRQHFSHLARLMKYIEPRRGSAYAFAIGNLSRDDTQYEPGRGGVALIFGLRIKGAKDHAGRQDPPFCHAVAAVDRQLDEAMILEAATAFYRKLLPDQESQAEGSGWYHSYVQSATNPDALLPLLRSYVADFADLPAPHPSGLGLRWSVEDVTPPKRVVIVHADAAPFEVIARCAARIAGVLVESDIRWTAISNGREGDVPGGVSVRFVPRREAGPEPSDVVMMALEDVPEDPRELAEKLFNAYEVRVSQMPELRMGWRQMFAQRNAGNTGGAAGEAADPVEARPKPWAKNPELATGEIRVDLEDLGAKAERDSDDLKAATGLVAEVKPANAAKAKKAGGGVGLLVGVGVAIAFAGVVAAVALGGGGPAGTANAAQGPSEVPTVQAVPAAMQVEAPPMMATVAPTAKPAATPEVKPKTAPSAESAGSAQASAKKGSTKKAGGTTKKSETTKKSGGSMFDVETLKF
ncbi:hypothetical protein KEG38_23985 [Polyangium jinanense]|uniref:hypothetical protein n=1 Tax=Polyangium jinanense TaxID=2829994 RepID=UPI002342440A|nr:hypothetical protein [Polyangium jinanense]MDC3956942.1 hypothetical protein [Polyangium jinanense]